MHGAPSPRRWRLGRLIARNAQIGLKRVRKVVNQDLGLLEDLLGNSNQHTKGFELIPLDAKTSFHEIFFGPGEDVNGAESLRGPAWRNIAHQRICVNAA